MEKKTYQSPQILCLGSVRELTALVAPCPGSALDDFASEDNICEIQNP